MGLFAYNNTLPSPNLLLYNYDYVNLPGRTPPFFVPALESRHEKTSGLFRPDVVLL